MLLYYILYIYIYIYYIAVAYADAHPNYSISTLQSQGFSKLKRKGYLSRWRNDVASGGTRYFIYFILYIIVLYLLYIIVLK